MKVILRDNVSNLGQTGQIVEVKDGYARNFLLPRKLAVAATGKNLGRLDHEKRLIGDLQKKQLTQAEKLAADLAAHSLTISCSAGEQDKLFGAVMAKDIAEALRRDGFSVDKRQILLPEPLKQLGTFTVPVKLGEGVEAQLKLMLVPK